MEKQFLLLANRHDDLEDQINQSYSESEADNYGDDCESGENEMSEELPIQKPAQLDPA